MVVLFFLMTLPLRYMPNFMILMERMAVILHDSLTGDALYRLLAGVGKHEDDDELERLACAAVDVILGNVCSDMP